MFGLKSKSTVTMQKNIFALMKGLARLNQKIDITNGLVSELVKGTTIVTQRLVKQEEKSEENEKFVAECLTNNTILYDRINELDERVCILAERLRASEGDGTDF